MSTTTSKVVPSAVREGGPNADRGSDGASPSQWPAALELLGPFAGVPSLDDLESLTKVPDRRVVFRGVDWSFYNRLVDSIPESSNIHVDYDGRDLEVMRKGRAHGKIGGLFGQFVEAVAQELGMAYSSLGDTTWKRPRIARGLEADRCYYFLPEKIAADAAALEQGCRDIADYPNPDLAIEVDISPPAVDRAGIYAALRVEEIWRFADRKVTIERLTADGRYVAVEASGFLPVRREDIERWIVEEDQRDESAWARKLRAEIRARRENQ